MLGPPYDQHDPDDPLSLQTSPCINVDTSHYYISCLKKIDGFNGISYCDFCQMHLLRIVCKFSK